MISKTIFKMVLATILTIMLVSGLRHYKNQKADIYNLNNEVKTTEQKLDEATNEVNKLKEKDGINTDKIKQLEDEKKRLEAELQAKLERQKLVANDPCRLVYDYKEWDGKTMYGICKAESMGNPKATGDTSLTFVKDGVTYGMSCGMLQVRVLPGRGITCEQMHNPEQNVAKAYEIWKAQSYTAWSVYSNGKYLKYI